MGEGARIKWQVNCNVLFEGRVWLPARMDEHFLLRERHPAAVVSEAERGCFVQIEPPAHYLHMPICHAWKKSRLNKHADIYIPTIYKFLY